MGIELKISEARMSFENLSEPKAFQDKPPPAPKRWSCVWLIDVASDTKRLIDEAIDRLGMEKWGKKWPAIKKTIANNTQKMCWQDGANKPDYDGYEGMWALTTNRQEKDGRPIVIDNDAQPIYTPSGDFNAGKAGRLYGGCYIRGTVELYGYENTGAGIAASFSVIQRLRKGDAFGGGKPADATGYTAVEDGADEAPMGAEEDEALG